MKRIFKLVVVNILTAEAKIILKKHKPKIIAVTGSVGKTSTKDAIYTVLKDKVKSRKNQKSFNSEFGVPLTILGLQTAWNSPLGWIKNLIEGLFIILFTREYPEVLVLEAGVDHPGDMVRLTSWLKPDMVVLTSLPDVPVHVEFFPSPNDVIKEKMKLVEALKEDGILIYNNDDEKVREVVASVRQQSFGYSRYSTSHFIATGDKIIYDGSSPIGVAFELESVTEKANFKVNGSVGLPNIFSYSAAAAVGHVFEISLTEAAVALSKHVPPPGRMRLLEGVKQTTIIDDTYNSSPTACERALQTLNEISSAKRKIAVLGDMLELGQYSVREHEKIGVLVEKYADILLTVGVRSRKIAEAALENGMDESNIFQYEKTVRAGDELYGMLEPGDVVLVKASQSIRAEKIVAKILNDPKSAEQELVRQEERWKNI